MSITIAGVDFANHSYDDRGDVLYVDVAGYDGSTSRHTRTRARKAMASSSMKTGG